MYETIQSSYYHIIKSIIESTSHHRCQQKIQLEWYTCVRRRLNQICRPKQIPRAQNAALQRKKTISEKLPLTVFLLSNLIHTIFSEFNIHLSSLLHNNWLAFFSVLLSNKFVELKFLSSFACSVYENNRIGFFSNFYWISVLLSLPTG